MIELKNRLAWFNSRLDKGEEQISDLENRAVELTQTGQQTGKKKKN